MKKIIDCFVFGSLALFALPAMAGSLVQSYWPLNPGDHKLFNVSGMPLTIAVSTNAGGEFDMVSSFAGSSQTLEFYDDNTDCYLVGLNDFGHVSFDTPVLFLNDNLLSKGGTARTTTTLNGGLAEVTITVTVGNAGKVKVPAGTFSNCKQIALRVKKDFASAGVEILTSSATTTVIAPGVGIIKTTLIADISAQLVNGTIAGVSMGDSGLAPITIDITGGTGNVKIKGPSGLVAPAGEGRFLELGASYTATAKATQGAVFQKWADILGNTLSTTPNLTFTMQSNLALQADFIPNPYLEASGRYIGLFQPYGTNTTLKNSGYITLTVNTKGTLSGYWQTGAVRHPVSGQLNAYLGYTNTYNIAGEGSVTIGLSALNGAVSGTIASDQGWTSHISAVQIDPSVRSYDGAGRYSVEFTGGINASADGHATANFAERGSAVLSGTVPDGARFSATSAFSDSDQWPFYAPLYSGRGYLMGWLEPGPGNGGTDYSRFTLYGNLYWLQRDGSLTTLSVNSSSAAMAVARVPADETLFSSRLTSAARRNLNALLGR